MEVIFKDEFINIKEELEIACYFLIFINFSIVFRNYMLCITLHNATWTRVGEYKRDLAPIYIENHISLL